MKGALAWLGMALAALGWAERQRLIASEEISSVGYLRLTHPDPELDEEEE